MKKKTIKNPHPGDVLKYDYLEELNISAYRLAKEIGVSESLWKEIYHCGYRVTPLKIL